MDGRRVPVQVAPLRSRVPPNFESRALHHQHSKSASNLHPFRTPVAADFAAVVVCTGVGVDEIVEVETPGTRSGACSYSYLHVRGSVRARAFARVSIVES